MESRVSLAELKVMVVEDDYILAMDTESALSAAGAEVVGPFAREEPAVDAIQREKLDAAVIDLNLGFGPTYVVAAGLQKARVPFVILTGYTDALPNELSDVPRLTKPVDTKRVVRELEKVISSHQ